MKTRIPIIITAFLLCSLAHAQDFGYSYDASGNRIQREVLRLITIYGNVHICGTETFRTSNGSTASWSVSSGFTLSTTTGSSTIVKSAGYNGQSGTLTAIINGDSIIRDIQACSITIDGETNICGTESYQISNGSTADWIVSSGFSLSTTTGSSTTVTPAAYNGQSGTLTAIINGEDSISRSIQACAINIDGNINICDATESYQTSSGAPADWSVSSGFNITSSSSNVSSVTVKPTSYNGQSGTLTATINGVPVTKDIEACTITIDGEANVCTTTETYQTSNGATATWSASGDFTLSAVSGSSTTVKPIVYSGQSGTLTATINGVPVTKTLKVCTINIDGETNICGPEIFQTSNGAIATWSVSGGFTVSSSSGSSTTVTALPANGQSGTLTATINGVSISKVITACTSSISGNATIYGAETYSLIPGQSATWSVNSGFSLSSTTGSSVTVTALPANGQSGTLTATVNGVTVASKTIYACNVTVSGPSNLCPSWSSVSASGAPDGFIWNKSDNIALSGSGPSISAMASGNSSGSGWISVVYNGMELKRLNLSVAGALVGGAFNDGGGDMPLNAVNFVTGSPVSVYADYPGATGYTWSLQFSNGYVYWGNYGYGVMGFYLDPGQSATFRVTAATSLCGDISSDYSFMNISRGGAFYYSIYPNPVSSVLYFEIDRTKFNNNTSRIANPQCEVQLISVQTGTLFFRQSVPNFYEDFNVDVSAVRDGLYILRMIQNGELVHTQTIMVQH